MKPEFALSLSFEGIRLLHRAAGGWRRVGEVAVDDPDLTGALGVLHSSASALSPGRVTTKLLIPNDQIKYLALETGAMEEVDRRIAARKALDGATPYAFEELVYDIASEGEMTYVAAVARETLSEAEAFAAQNKFQPLCFVAAPEPGAFPGEPFFGTTEVAAELGMADVSTLRDAFPVVETDQIDVPEGVAAADFGAAEGTTEADAAPQVETAPEPEPDPVTEPAPEPEPAQEVAETPADETPTAGFGFASRRRAADPVPDPNPVEVPAPSPDEASEAPTDVFVSARRRKEPALDADLLEPTPLPQIGDSGEIIARRDTDVTEATAPALGAANRDYEDTAIPAPQVTIAQASSPMEPAQPERATSRLAGFLSARRAQPDVTVEPEVAVATAQVATAVAATPDEARRMTVFGARKPAANERVGGKPRYLGLVLTAILLIFLAGVAAWASIFVDDGLARWFGGRTPTQVATIPELPEVEDPVPTELAPIAPAPELASLAPGLSGFTDDEELDFTPEPRDRTPIVEYSRAELEARYAVTGVWPLAPDNMISPGVVPIDDLYVTSIDPVSSAQDAVAIPSLRLLQTDVALLSPASPPPPDREFDLDERGLVRATPEGALSPEGILVFLGPPPLRPPAFPERVQPTPETDQLAGFRPRSRPEALQENHQRATLGGLTREELAAYRPEARPEALLPETEAPEVNSVPELLVFRPEARPSNFDRTVARAQRQPPSTSDDPGIGRGNTATGGTQVASIAPRTVTPDIPSSASVARQATERRAINLNRMNLIGVYGTPSSRRALVRLSNGRYKKVKVGDRIDGGRVSAIGDSELRYIKGSRNLVLKMPKG
ncbi:MAG: hypothetical protein HRU30_13130 [Rhodobacteraceae bacterium]|nr:hypothetical protein [Paracoccaceae bacterium]